MMSWVRIWVHMVFAAKNRGPYLRSKSFRFKVFNDIKENAEEKSIQLNFVNPQKVSTTFREPQISNLKSQISNLKSQILNLKS